MISQRRWLHSQSHWAEQELAQLLALLEVLHCSWGARGLHLCPPPHPDPSFKGPEWGVSVAPAPRVPQGVCWDLWQMELQLPSFLQRAGMGHPGAAAPCSPPQPQQLLPCASPALQLLQPSRDTHGGLGSTNAAFTPTS